MKRIIFILSIALFVACGKGKDSDNGLSIDNVKGDWKLIEYEKTDYDFELKDCDKISVWKFTDEKAEPLGDGTEVYKLIVEKGENCKKWFGFESKWTINNGKLFISQTSIGGVGGVSHAGLFESVNFEGDKMIVKVKNSTITFQKAN